MKPQGIIVPMVTPLDETGTTIQLNQVEKLVQFLIQKKIFHIKIILPTKSM